MNFLACTLIFSFGQYLACVRTGTSDMSTGRIYKAHANSSLRVELLMNSSILLPVLKQSQRGAIAYRTDELYEDFQLNETNNSLVMFIPVVQMLHNGTYTYGEVKGKRPVDTFSIVVLIPPNSPRIVPLQAKGEENSRLEITCEAIGGNPPPIFQWYHRGQLIEQKSIKRVSIVNTVNQSKLIFNKTTYHDDNTNITCTVINEAIQAPLSISSTISIRFIPRISVLLNGSKLISNGSVVALAYGQPIKLTADIRSNPPVDSITWTLPSNATINNGSTVYLKTVNESGHYELSALNEAGISIFGFTTFLLHAPNVTISSTNVTLDLNEKLVLTCEVRSDPPPIQIFWKRNGLNISTSFAHNGDNVSAESHGVLTSSTLTIDPITRTDSGIYTCVAGNVILQHGSLPYHAVGHADAFVTVRYQPAIAMRNQQISGDVGETVTLYCDAKGVPIPDVNWIKDDHSMPCTSSNSTGDSISCALQISPVMQTSFGQYTCQARNQMGTETLNVVLTTKREPGIPSNISALAVGYSWIRVCWSPGFDGGASQEFVLESCLDKPILTKRTCANLTGIVDTDMCTIRLRARNSIGASSWTKPKDVSLLQLPYQARDMPFLRDANFVGKQLHFGLSPLHMNLSHSGMCLQVYFARRQEDSMKSAMFDKFQTCLPLAGSDKASFEPFFNKQLADVSELRISVCALDRQSICGPEVVLDITGLPIRSKLMTKRVTLASIACSALLSATLTAMCLCMRRRRRAHQVNVEETSPKKNARKTVRFASKQTSRDPSTTQGDGYQPSVQKHLEANKFDGYMENGFGSELRSNLFVSRVHAPGSPGGSDLGRTTSLPSYHNSFPSSCGTDYLSVEDYSTCGTHHLVCSLGESTNSFPMAKSGYHTESTLMTLNHSTYEDCRSIDDGESGYSTPSMDETQQTGLTSDNYIVTYEATV